MTNELVVSPLEDSPTEVVSRPSARHLPALDGIRGVAILLVLLFHLGSILRSSPFLSRILNVGWIGVDLFFVLSGFLITRILLSTREDARYYSRFYIRRGLRIWPLYFAYVLVFYLGLHFVGQIHAVQQFAATSNWLREYPLRLSRPLIVYLLFVQNLVGFGDMLGVTWSLCIEEHFYLAWPVLVRKLSFSLLKRLLWVAFLLSPVLRLGYYFFAKLEGIPFGAMYTVIYHATPFHLDSIVAGCLLGLYWVECKDVMRLRLRFWILFLTGMVASSVVLWPAARDTILCCFSFTALSVMFAGVTGLALLGWNRRVLVNPALRYCGKISYGFYLIHAPIVNVFQSHPILHKIFRFHSLFLMEIAGALSATVLSFAVAIVSWNFFEKPILGLKDKWAP